MNVLKYFKQDEIVTTTDQPVTTPIVNLSGMRGFSVQVAQTGTGNSVLKLQASNDGINFTDITGATLAIADTDVGIMEYNEPNFHYARAVITPDASLALRILVVRKGI